ncbi:hypothetical protein ACHAXR_012693 [Thalassiosira sp. AJA248-18]
MAMKGVRKLPILAFMLGQICIFTLGYVYRSIWHQLGEESSQYLSQPTRRQVTPTARAALPHKCGMVFFYHIPSTGGATIVKWLTQYTSGQNGTAKFFTHWHRSKDGLGGAENGQKVFIEGNKKHGGMNEFVQNFGSDEWRISHCHHSSMHLNVTEHSLSQWRSAVESQGCAFIANVMLRDPLSHSMSLYKHIKRFNSSRDVWADHLFTKSDSGYWQTQLDYFLYNFLARNPDGVDKETKIQRALELLQNHFDLVTVGDHDEYKRQLLEMTGWEDKEMLRTNTHPKEILFTKKEVEKLQKMMEDNGDTEFIYKVKSMYKNGVLAGSDSLHSYN